MAAATIRRPMFPLMSPAGNGTQVTFEPLENLLSPAHHHLFFQNSDPNRLPGRGFDNLKAWNCCDSGHVGAFKDLANYCTTVQAYKDCLLPQVPPTRLIDSRNAAVHNVLNLPSAEEIKAADAAFDEDSRHAGVWRSKEERQRMGVYECVRLTALLLNVLVTFPVPRSGLVRASLMKNLRAAFGTLDDCIYPQRPCDETRFWCLFIVGCAAEGTDEEESYMEKIVQVARRLDVESWCEAEEILEKFLWMKTACSRSGKAFWQRRWNRVGVSVI